MASAPNVESIYRLTSTQEGILFHAVQNEADGLYLQQFTAVLAGELDVQRFRDAWAATVARHAALRALFTWKKRPHPLQVVRQSVDLPLEVLDDAALLEEGPALDAYLDEDRQRGLPLEVAPLMRLTLVVGGAARHRFIWTFHHIALDGWSMRIALQETLQRYAGIEPSAEAPSHKAFVDWLGQQSEADALAFWKKRLRGFDEPTRLAVSAPLTRPLAATHEDHELRLSAEQTAALTQAARSSRVTLNTQLRAAWALALARYSGTDDVVFGATVAGRPPEIPGIEGIVGMFIHTIPVRARIDRTQRADAWCAELQGDQLDALPFETASLAAIQRASDVAPGTPLFETILVIENHASAEGEASNTLRLEAPRYLERSHYPLALLVVPGPELQLVLVRDGSKVTAETAQNLLGSVRQTLTRIAEHPASTVADLAALGADEIERLEGYAQSRTGGTGPHAGDVIARMDAVAQATPSATAIRFVEQGTTGVSYGELVERSRGIARGLRSLGVAKGDLVAVRLPRGIDAVAVILGVLRAGAAYVPIDPESPEGRLGTITAAVPLRLVVGVGGVDPADVLAAGGAPAEGIPDATAAAADLTSLAYVLFTSGTTGVPKGVEITRDALARSTFARDGFYGDGPERFLLLSPLHFDSSVAGLFWTLVRGGTLVLPAPGDERDPRRIVQTMEAEQVSHTLLLPSLYEVVLETAEGSQLDSLTTVIVAGEAVSPALIVQHHGLRSSSGAGAAPRLVNEYGPTEATVWATAMELTPADAVQPVPIGKPIGEVLAYVLDAHRALVPHGVSGELYLGGPTLALGYAGDADLTLARFSPTDPGTERLYRTGDRVRFDGAGRLLFLGRVDRQVKIRGQRIELGEVEAALQGLPGVREAVVVAAAGPGGQPQLVAFITGPGASAASAEASDRLTGAMRPKSVIALESFPRTASGKVDQPALIALAAEQARSEGTSDQTGEGGQRGAANGGRAAEGEIESTLLTIWREVLGIEDIAADQDFYGLGGDSLTSIRLVSRAHKAGLEVDLADFAANPTIAGMALAAGLRGEAAPAPAAASPQALPLTPVQEWFFALDLPDRQHWNQAVRIELAEGEDPARLGAALVEAVQHLPVRHDALRLRFQRVDGRWTQSVCDPVAAQKRVDVESIDLRAVAADQWALAEQTAALAAQTGFDLAEGRVLAARIFVTDEGVRLLLVAHHLVVDAVSWATLTGDVVDLARGKALAPVGASFAQWVQALQQRADSAELRAEAETWGRVAADAAAISGKTSGESCSSVASEATVAAELDHGQTTALLTDIHGAYGTRPQEILLAALSRALSRSSGRLRHLIDMEGHGREAQAAGAAQLDVSATVGWMTTVWPLLLAEDAAPSAGSEAGSIKTTKEAVRSVPNRGIGFGLLAHMASDGELRGRVAAAPARELLFNYLGRIDGTDAQASPAAALDDPRVGPSRSNSGTRAYPLELNAWVADGALRLRWSYSSEVHAEADVQRLSDALLDEVRALIAHCQNPDAGGVTPSDFPLAGVDQAELDRIAKLLGGG